MSAVAPPRRSFWALLLLIVAAALVVRIGYVATAKAGPCEIQLPNGQTTTVRSDCTVGDEIYYNAAANELADGGWFEESVVFTGGREPGPAADHPPAAVVVLGAVSWAGDVPPLSWFDDDTHITAHRYAMAVLGGVVVLLVGIAGRELGRSLRLRRPEEAGWVAAGIAAVYPGLWAADGVIFAETVANIFVVSALALALRTLRIASWPGVVGLGAVCGLAALARAELALLVPLLAVPVVVVAFAGRDRPAAVSASVAVSMLVVAPWVGYNLARFEEPTLLSTNLGLALAGSNCDGVYFGDGTGLTSLEPPCVVDPTPSGETWDQSQISDAWVDQASDYMREHAGRVPVVMSARVGRTWSLYRPADMLGFNEGEGRGRSVTLTGMLAFYVILAGATAGAMWAWRRRRVVAWAVLAPLVVVTLASASTYGQTRFRGPGEPSLVLLAGLCAVVLVRRVRKPRSNGPEPRPQPSLS